MSNSDPAALLAAVNERTAAIIAEPLQGEGGVRPLGRRDGIQPRVLVGGRSLASYW